MSYIWSGLTSQNRSGVSSFYLYDSQGSVRNLVDAAGAITDTYVYTAFGVELLTGIGTVNPFRYVGLFGYYLESVNLYYVRARWLDAVKGRWDSRVSRKRRTLGEHPYGYTINSPANIADPSGSSIQIVYSQDGLRKSKTTEGEARETSGGVFDERPVQSNLTKYPVQYVVFFKTMRLTRMVLKNGGREENGGMPRFQGLRRRALLI